MAAHGLTILRQFQKALIEDRPVPDVLRLIEHGLSAPGTCVTRGFRFQSWAEIERMADRVKRGEATLDDLFRVVVDATDAHRWMDAYPTMEAVGDAARAYVRHGTPYWKRRMARFDAGEAPEARALVTARWPLDRRAPVVL